MFYQSFLPVVNAISGIMLGMVPIEANTVFTGDEVTYTIGGYEFDVKRTSFFVAQSSDYLRSYMAISQHPTTRLHGASYQAIPGFIPIEDLFTDHPWQMVKSMTNERKGLEQSIFIRALNSGQMSRVEAVPLPPPAPPSSGISNWAFELPLRNAPVCTFADIPFSYGRLYTSDLPAKALSLSLPVPSGVIDHWVKIFMFTDPGQYSAKGATSNSLRFIKMMSGILPSDTFEYAGEATLEDGSTETVNMTVTFT